MPGRTSTIIPPTIGGGGAIALPRVKNAPTPTKPKALTPTRIDLGGTPPVPYRVYPPPMKQNHSYQDPRIGYGFDYFFQQFANRWKNRPVGIQPGWNLSHPPIDPITGNVIGTNSGPSGTGYGDASTDVPSTDASQAVSPYFQPQTSDTPSTNWLLIGGVAVALFFFLRRK